MAGPLTGIKILDLSSVVLGPLATQIMGDLGADVIKIEAPGGDSTRYTGPKRSNDMSALFLGLNRNKRSVILNLKKPAAKKALWRLIDTSDVFIHSIRPQKIKKLGFSHEDVCARNKRIIYVGIHGYQIGGPYSGEPAYDDVIQGQAGNVDLMARLVGEPRYMPTIMADKTCALVAANSVMAALFERERSKKGQFVEIPMFETMVAYNLTEHLYGYTFDPPEDQIGYTRVLAPSRRPYKTKDGYICILVYTDKQWEDFWKEVGRPELIKDAKFATLSARSTNIEELYRTARECVANRNTAEWQEALDRLQIPHAPITTMEMLFEDPHLKKMNFFKKIEHPTEGNIVIPDSPVGFSRTPTSLNRLQPGFGEHSEEILKEAGLSNEEIKQALK